MTLPDFDGCIVIIEENAFVGNTEILRVVGARPAARSEMVRENELLALFLTFV